MLTIYNTSNGSVNKRRFKNKHNKIPKKTQIIMIKNKYEITIQQNTAASQPKLTLTIQKGVTSVLIIPIDKNSENNAITSNYKNITKQP